MDEEFADMPLDVERLIDDCVTEALDHEDPERFLAWFGAHLRDYYFTAPPELLGAPGLEERLAALMGRSLWNAMPLPGNGLRPRPLPAPGRNDPCPCGSGAKHKHCCAHFPNPFPVESGMLLPRVLERMPKEALERELRAGRVPVEAVVELAEQRSDRPMKAVTLLEPLFAAPIRKPDERYDEALNRLCDLYDTLGRNRKKDALLRHVLDTVERSPLRSGAWQRLAAMRMDAGDTAGAWQAHDRAQRDDPDSPAIGLLEIQLLMAEGRAEEAAERAGFWLKRLRRLGWDETEGITAFLAQMARDPQGAMADLGVQVAGGAGARLLAWLEQVAGRALPVYRVADASETGEDEDGESTEEALAARLRAMGIPREEVPRALEMLRDQLGESAEDDDEPVAPDEAPVESVSLRPPRELAALETRWHEVFPLGKPFSVQEKCFDLADPWDPETEAEWMDFLEAHPAAFDSLDILDDLATALAEHPQAGSEWLERAALDPLLRRAEAIIERALVGTAEPRLAWLYAENRPALRALARRAGLHGRCGEPDEAVRIAERLLALNPADNHGFRALVVNHRLRQGDDTGALALAEAYPADVQPECPYGRVLALYRLGRMDEARAVLDEAVEMLPKVVRYLTAERVRQPRIDIDHVEFRGDDQAWLYREDMRDAWAATPGALEWLARAVPRAPA